MSLMINQSSHSFSDQVKQRPLRDNISMIGYDIGEFNLGSGGNQRYGCAFDGKHLWLSPQSADILTKFDINKGTYTNYSFDNNVNGNKNMPDLASIQMSNVIYDGYSIWILPRRKDSLIKVNVTTGSMQGFSTENGANGNMGLPKDGVIASYGGVFDGTNIWFAGNDTLIKLNPKTGTLNGYNYPEFGLINYRIAFDGRFLWIVPVGSAMKHIIRMNPETLAYQTYSFNHLVDSNITVSLAVFCDQTSVWIGFSQENKLMQFNTANEEFKTFSMAEGINGNSNMGNASEPQAGSILHCMTYDGKYIWLSPLVGDRLIRLDPSNGTMTGYNFIGTNIGNWTTLTNRQCRDITFDGKNLWLTASPSNRLLKVSSANDPTHTVTEEYEDTTGNSIKPGAYRWITPGDAYTGVAPAVPGRSCVGHKIDGAPLQTGTTATIPDVRGDHTVTFVYEEGDEPGTETHTITQEYQMEDGTALRPTDTHSAAQGGSFSGTAPHIPGYHCIGHRLDGGPLQAAFRFSVSNVQADHTIIFLYRPDDPEPGEGCCQCCTKVRVEIQTCTGNKKLLQGIHDALQADECGCCK